MRAKHLRQLLVVILLVVMCVSVFVACDITPALQNKQVPVYKGMTISKNRVYASVRALGGEPNYGPEDGHGEHDSRHDERDPAPGCCEGDHDHRDDDFDPNKPFEDDQTPTIEDKAQSTLDVIGASESIYYADKNQDIFITVKLSNPDNYEILSFTLNGKKYSNYMFEDGSDMENLILKVNVGDNGGIQEYTIDAIKYVDGTDIKDVLMDGDKTVKAGVRSNDQTHVNVTNNAKSMTSISFDANIVDLYSLIEKSEGYAKAVLYDGENMISKDIAVGENVHVSFDNLTPNTVYQYGVVAFYDDLSGNGAQLNVLYKNTVYTDTIVLFKDVQVSQETLSWQYLWNDSVQDKTITALSLWQNDTKIKDLDTTSTALDGLHTNTTYTLKATYKNLQNQDEIIEIVFTTQTKSAPSVSISNVQPTQTSVSYAIDVTDVDNVGAISKIELLHGTDEPIVAKNITDREFAGLLSNNEYTVKVTYTYDLNDGNGKQDKVVTSKFNTVAKAEPSVTISNLSSVQNAIECDLSFVDTDKVGKVDEVAIYVGDTKVKTVELANHVKFEGLESGKEYKVVVRYSFDLNDGKGLQTTAVSKSYSTLVDSIVVENLVLLNNNVVRLGEELNLRVYFVNSSEIELTSIYVNGQKATVVGGDRIESAIIKFVPASSGLCKFAIDKVNYVINGVEVSQLIDTSVEVEYPIYRDISPVYTPLTISKYENTGDGVYIHFENEDGYKVYKVNESNDFITLGSGTIFTKDISITSIEYGYDNYGHTTQNCNFVNDYWSGSIHSVTELKRIYTADDFFAMTDGYYLLMNDLDLRSVQTKSQIQLTGVFDANGHTIRGLSNVVDTSKGDYFDLFAGGSIYDATFSELYISVNSPNGVSVNPLGYATLYNCTVKGDIVLSNGYVNSLNIANSSTSYTLNVTIGTNSTTQKIRCK